MLEIQDLHVESQGKEILKGVNLTLEKGKIHALMGPNGSGKSTLAKTIMGHPRYTITKGKILYKGQDISSLRADERAKLGVFLSFQYPKEIPGVTISNFLRTALNSRRDEPLSVLAFRKLIKEKIAQLGMDESFLSRSLNQGFSGGEKKKAETLQLLTLDPELAILDETDSGLDIDALKTVSQGVKAYMDKDKCLLVITHYKRILEYLKPDKVFILSEGKIIHKGDGSIVDELEEKGYGWIDET